jgi:HEPN domain-containing protein
MRTREEVISELIQQWLDRAELDFSLARHLVEENRFLNAVGFHSQQAAEKLMKAFLVHHQVEFPRTHNLDDLLKLIAPVDRTLAESLRSVGVLTPYGVDVRYPGDQPELDLQGAEAAIEQAARVRRAVYAALGEPIPPG